MAKLAYSAIAFLLVSVLSSCVDGPPNVSETQASASGTNDAAAGLTETRQVSDRSLREPDSQFSASAENGGVPVETGIVQEALSPAPNNPQISDTQEFEAVASRETIESDAERLKRLRSSYKLIESEAVPERPDAVNIAEYALSTVHEPGEKLYRRVRFGKRTPLRELCAIYMNDDEAQHNFLSQGGPEKDPLEIDPDGDGFACGWSPIPYRNLFGLPKSP